MAVILLIFALVIVHDYFPGVFSFILFLLGGSFLLCFLGSNPLLIIPFIGIIILLLLFPEEFRPKSPEEVKAILKRKALDRKCPVSDDVLEFLACDSGHDVRTLEGRLTKVIFASKLHEESISLSLAKLALSESVNEETEQDEITPEKILNTVCAYFKQKKDDLLGKGKKADLVKARQICAYLLCEMLSLPLVSVGNILGGRDHTTIMYARDKMEKMITLNDKIAKEIDDIKSIILKK